MLRASMGKGTPQSNLFFQPDIRLKNTPKIKKGVVLVFALCQWKVRGH
jgi:hypothetical protein